MKKFLLSASLIIIAICIIAITQIIPKSYSVTLEGVKYQLGADHKAFTSPVTIRIDGELKKSLTNVKTFNGIIDVEGENIPVPSDQRKLEIKFQENGAGPIVYSYNDNGSPVTYSYGTLYVNTDFSEVTIATSAKDAADASKGSWTAEDGYMITAPAGDREEALKLSNELMKDFLNGKTLE